MGVQSDNHHSSGNMIADFDGDNSMAVTTMGGVIHIMNGGKWTTDV
jgi:hypothetical protein